MAFRPNTPNRWTLVLLMVAVSGGVHHPTTIGAFLNEIGDDFGVSDAAVGQIGTVTFGSSFLVAAVVAPFIGRLELGRLLWAGLALLGTMGVLTAVSPSFALLFPIRGVAGVAGGIIWGASFASVARAWPDSAARKSRMGFVVGALAGGPGVITPILRIIGDATSWEVAIAVHGIFYIFVAVLVAMFLPVLPGTETASARLRETYRAALRVITTAAVGIPLTQRLLSQTLLNALTSFMAGFLAAEYLGGSDWIGPSFAMIAFGFMVSSFLSGRVMAALGGPLNAVITGTMLTIVVSAALAWVTPAPAVTAVLILLFGLTVGIFFNGLVNLIIDGAGENQATAVFVDGAFGPMGGLAGSAIGALAVATSAEYLGWKWLMTALAMALLLPLYALHRTAATRPGPARTATGQRAQNS